MLVEFEHDGRRVAYDFGAGRVPVVGELVSADGSDPEFPQGDYRVTEVAWAVGLRGPERAVCRLYKLKHPAASSLVEP